MSRDVYGNISQSQRSPKPTRRPDIASHGQSSKYYNTSSSVSQPVSTHGSPVTSRTGVSTSEGRRGRQYGVSRSSNASPLTLPSDSHVVPHSISTSAFNVSGHPSSSAYYGGDDLGSPTMDGRSGAAPAGSGHHRSRSATRVPLRNYHSLERDQDREFMPIREPRERSLERTTEVGVRHPRSRERSLDRTAYRERDDHVTYRDYDGTMDADPYRDTSGHMSRNTHASSYGESRHNYGRGGGDGFVMELQARLSDLQSQYTSMKRDLEATTQKLGSSMHSIKTFWSPELKKERALRKEESAKYGLLNDQLKMLRSENQKQSTLIRQLEEELRMAHLRNPDAEVQQHLEALYNEKEHMTKEIFLLRETIKELEMRIETQKQTLAARDESIKNLMEIKGVGGKIMEEERLEMERLKNKLIETESRCKHFETMLDSRDKDLSKMEELRIELNRRDQEIMAMGAKMKTLEEQHHDYQRHIAVLKESLCAKEEHYNMLQADVEELRVRLEEKNKLIEKKTQQTMTSTQERNKLTQEVQELRDHMEIKDRKINVLQRKIENLEDLLKEKDNQVDMARARLTAMQAHHSSSEGALSSLEEAIGDKEKQISQLREQRDRAEQEKNEERELHERDIAEYKMKMHGLESEMEKLQSDLQNLRSQRRPSAQEGSQQGEVIALRRQIEEKQKMLEEQEKKLKKYHDKVKQVESQQAQGNQNEVIHKQLIELQEYCKDIEKEKEAAIKEAKKSQESATQLQMELERLLELMTSVEKEKFALNEQIKELQDSLKDKEAKLHSMKRGQQAEKTKNAQMMEEARRRESEAAKETSKAQEQVVQQQGRIEELEEALRESVRITAQREVAVAQKEAVITAAEEKIANLQAEVRSLQNAHNARCTNCPRLKVNVSEMEKKLQKLTNERKFHLEQLFEFKQEALSAAISEKDSHLAVLEVSGIKNAKTAEEVDRLKMEKKRLVERIKTENENRVELLLELDESLDINGKNESSTVASKSREIDEDGLRSLS